MIKLRSPKPGDLLVGITKVHGEYYAEKYGWVSEFECNVAKIIFDHLGSPANVKQAYFIA